MLNVLRGSARLNMLEKRHDGNQKEYLIIMIEMLDVIW